MRIVSTTLAGPGAERTIGDALRSARGLADCHLVILSGCDPAPTLAAAREAIADSAPLVVAELDWPGDYAAARNAALDTATALDADWALTLDCDERLELRREDLPLDRADIHSINIKDRDHGYQKERLIRCGVGARWQYPVHERLIASGTYALGKGTFWELPKDGSTQTARMLRGIEAYGKLIAEGGADCHVRRHYAECLGVAGRIEEAQEQWRIVSADPDAKLYERTWCEFRLAEREFQAGNLEAARDRAAAALGRDPGLIQELGALLACLCSLMGDNQSALLWALTVIGAPVDETRGGHRFVVPCVEQCRQLAGELMGNPAAFGVRGATQSADSVKDEGAFRREHFEHQQAWLSDYEIAAEALRDTVDFASHIDLGAGRGKLVEALLGIGIDSSGIELSREAEALLSPDTAEHIAFGVGLDGWAASYELQQRDMVSCVEVLEHLPPEDGPRAVAAICSRSSRWVYFSAAAPGQPGVGHINCQPQSYWIDLFRANGFDFDLERTGELKARLASVKRAWWLLQNALIFRRRGAAPLENQHGQSQAEAEAPEVHQGQGEEQGLPLLEPLPVPHSSLGRGRQELSATEAAE